MATAGSTTAPYTVPHLARAVPAPDQTARVEAEQVAMLYRTLPGATATGVACAVIICACFYVYEGSQGILLWLALHLAGKLRYPQIRRYFADPQAAAHSHHWAFVATRELYLTSAIWGLAPWLLLTASNVPLAALLMLVMLTLASAGMLSVAPVRSAIFAHAVPMTIGLTTALAWHGNGLQWVLAGCCVLYLGVTLGFALRHNELIARALQERFGKEALADQLAQQVSIARRANEEKSRFFASASHDLRQPLHAIALFGAVLDKDLKGTAQHANAVRLMQSVEALGVSLDTMLDVSRLEAGVIIPQPRSLAINTLFQSLHVVFAQRAEAKGLHLRMRASPLSIRTDPDLLQRLLGNVIENAVKYTNDGGIVVVARLRGAHVWIDCYDSGIGIPDEHLPRIFDEFYQAGNPARDRARGLGMGLAIVRRLGDLLGHDVQVTTRPGQGTRFRIIVPVSETPAQPANLRPRAPREPGPTELPRHVLLLDDEVEIGDAAAALLQSYGIDTEVVRTEQAAQAALDAAQQRRSPFDALVCDYRLAEGADGLAAALRLRARATGELPVLLVTGETSPDRLQRVQESGMTVLFKPTTGPALLQALAAVCRRAVPAQADT